MENPLTLVPEAEERELICFVCTGNTCRSPMAAAVFNHLAEIKNLPVRAISAGLYIGDTSIAEHAICALEAAGIKSTPANNYRAHIACEINEAIVMRCSRIVGITSSHAFELFMRFPQSAGKISALREDIADPYGFDQAVYDRCLASITRVVTEEFFHDRP